MIGGCRITNTQRNLLLGLVRAKKVEPQLTIRPIVAAKHAIVAEHGRVGKVVCALLKQHGVPYIAVDHDAKAVTQDRRSGYKVYYGDASNADFLKACGLTEATGIIITIHMQDMIDEIVEQVRRLRPDMLIVSRTGRRSCTTLYAVGATDVVPETIEASLQLSEAALAGRGDGECDSIDPREAGRVPSRAATSRQTSRTRRDQSNPREEARHCNSASADEDLGVSI